MFFSFDSGELVNCTLMEIPSNNVYVIVRIGNDTQISPKSSKIAQPPTPPENRNPHMTSFNTTSYQKVNLFYPFSRNQS
jgi:hypothetical protein